MRGLIHKGTFRLYGATIIAALVVLILSFISCQDAKSTELEVYVPHSVMTRDAAMDLKSAVSRVAGFRDWMGSIALGIHSVVDEAPGAVEWTVNLPGGESRLEFTLGFRCPEDVVPGPVAVRVTAIAGDQPKVIYSNRFWIRHNHSIHLATEARISLDEFAGREVTLRFESIAEETSPDGVRIVWGYPAIYRREKSTLPNIILICMDALRADRVGYCNPESKLMPALEALAGDGVAFRHAISQAPWTLPSVSSVLTGVYPSFHAAGRRIDLGEIVARENLSEEQEKQGIVIGKSQFLITRLSANAVTLPEYLEEKYRCHLVNGNTVIGRGTDVQTRFATHQYGTPLGWLLTERAVEWLEANADKRFFLYVHYMEPHEWPFNYDRRWRKDGKRDPEKIRWLYDELVRMGDGYLGEFIDQLKLMGLYDSSLIIFYADHGEHLFDPGWNQAGHGGSLSNILLEVPLVVKFPGGRHAGEVVDDYVKLVDIFDTIIEAAEVQTPEGFESMGVSLRRVVEGELGGKPRDIVSERMLSGAELIALQSGKYRFIRHRVYGRSRLVEASTDQRIPFGQSREIREITQRLRDALTKYLELAELLEDGSSQAEFTQEELEALRQLGYIQ